MNKLTEKIGYSSAAIHNKNKSLSWGNLSESQK